MKKFSLKPLGDSCIKQLCKSWFFIGLIMAFCVSACSDDDNNVVTPKFPEKQNIICNAGKTTEFTFETNTNWSLTSSAIWCKFEKDGIDEFILSGEAGKQTVTITVTDDGQKVDNISIAKLELTMGGQTIVIGEITRSAVDYELKIYDEQGNEIEELEVGYDTYIPFKVKANFRFAATNLPSWVALEGNALVGAINKEVKGGLQIIQDGNCEKYPVEASDKNVITFSDEAGKAFFPIKISYKGMSPEVIDITTPTSYSTGWMVSMDGKTFTQKSTGGNTGDATIQGRMPFTIKTLKDDYEIVFLSKGWDDNVHIVGSDYDFFNYEWMHYDSKGGKINLTVDEYIPNSMLGDPEDRAGYVLAFSRAEYESIKDNLEETIVENGEIAYKYEQRNLLIAFTQKEVKEEQGKQAFKITYYDPVSGTMQEAIHTKADHDYEYGIDDVYVMKQPDSGSYSLTINPNMDEADWEVQAYMDDENVTADYVEGGDNEFMLANSIPLSKDLHVCIKQNSMNVKVLIITPNE